MSIHTVYNHIMHSSNLLHSVRRYVETHQLFQPGAHLVLGVSGGADSLCLLDVLTALSSDWGLTLSVAHLDHGLRPEATAEAERVRAEAAARGWAFFLERADTRAQAARHKLSLEEAARVLRYTFLAQVAQSAGASTIAVAHTADDQAETVLMHFLRGSGLAGLRGMLPKTQIGDWRLGTGLQSPLSDLSIVRPLLATTRASVDAYCAERGLQPVHDASNADTTFFRNRLRHELLPALETYNPNIRAVLNRTAEVVADDYALLARHLDAVWQRLVRTEGLQVAFDRRRWRALTTSEQRALLRRAAHRLLPAARDLDFIPIEAAVRFSRTAAPGRSCDLFGGLRLKVTGEAIVIGPWDYRPVRADVPLLDEAGRLSPAWRFIAKPLATWSLAALEVNADRWRAYVDAERLPALEPDWRVRARRPGDRFQPLGLGGRSVKLSDFFINAKIDEALRDRWPLVTCRDDIVWVAGLRLDERYKVTAATQRTLQLEFIRHEA